jgi:hypothetical protein
MGMRWRFFEYEVTKPGEAFNGTLLNPKTLDEATSLVNTMVGGKSGHIRKIRGGIRRDYRQTFDTDQELLHFFAQKVFAGEYLVFQRPGDVGEGIRLRPLQRSREPDAPRRPRRVPARKRTHYIEIQLKDEDEEPTRLAECEILLDDGTHYVQRTNDFGVLRIDGLSAGGTFNFRIID